MSYEVAIRDVTKKYGDFIAVDKVSLDIKEGELFTLLGPSGCGKTTLLRMIAGFNAIEGGEIAFGDKVMNQVPAHKRDIGMVFQNYAIFPHMTVGENVAYGLKAKKMPKDQIVKKVDEALRLVQIEKLKDRKPQELSGGQQQRVALARAIVIEPGILLMDEPLSNLDAKLRIQMRSTIRKLQKDLGITTIYVTHDQEEALAISDKIAVMREGKIAQIGTPEAIYKKPKNLFVAGFIGTSNFLKCQVQVLNQGEGTEVNGSLGSLEKSVLIFEERIVQEGNKARRVNDLARIEETEKVDATEALDNQQVVEESQIVEEPQMASPQIAHEPQGTQLCEVVGKVTCGKDLMASIPLKVAYTGPATLSVRPGQLRIGKEGMLGKVLFATFLGEYVAYEVALEEGEMVEVHEYIKDTSRVYKEGEMIRLAFNPSQVSLYADSSQEEISW